MVSGLVFVGRVCVVLANAFRTRTTDALRNGGIGDTGLGNSDIGVLEVLLHKGALLSRLG